MRRFFLFIVLASTLALGACAKDKKGKEPTGDPVNNPESAPTSEPSSEPTETPE